MAGLVSKVVKQRFFDRALEWKWFGKPKKAYFQYFKNKTNLSFWRRYAGDHVRPHITYIETKYQYWPGISPRIGQAMKLRTSSYEYYFRPKTHSHLLSSQKTAFRLAQLEGPACAEWEAGDVTAQWCDHVDWDKVSSPLACSHEFFWRFSKLTFWLSMVTFSR